MKKYTWFLLMSAVLILAACKESTPEPTKNTTDQTSKTVKAATAQRTNVSSTDHTQTGNMHWYGMGDVADLLKKEKKMILVDVYTKWCGPCKMMDARTFTDASVQSAINEKFYPVKFDAEGPDPIDFNDKTWANPNYNPNKTRGRNAVHELSRFFNVRGYPSLVILDENYNIIKKIVGFKTPDQLIGELAAI